MRAKQKSEIQEGGKEEREGCVVFRFPFLVPSPKQAGVFILPSVLVFFQ